MTFVLKDILSLTEIEFFFLNLSDPPTYVYITYIR